MKPSLKLSLKLFILLPFIFTILGCDCDVEFDAGTNNKIFVIVDESASVVYGSKDKVKGIISGGFENTFRYMRKPLEFFQCSISTQTNVVPHSYSFSIDFPDQNQGEATIRKEVNDWEAEKSIWINNSVDSLTRQVIDSKSGNTDVFGMFEAIEQIAKNLKPKDTLNILVFSDMKHSASGYELANILENRNATQFGKEESTRIMKPLRIGDYSNTPHPYYNFQIITPDNFTNTSKIVKFWNSFFEEWGLPKKQFNFQ
jgi:hypothetical protein